MFGRVVEVATQMDGLHLATGSFHSTLVMRLSVLPHSRFFNMGFPGFFGSFGVSKRMDTMNKEQDDSKIENGGYFTLFHFFNVTTHERLTFVS